ncbi:hypothetical protein CFOL_v3_22872, partial [Cephalotus follicularis]
LFLLKRKMQTSNLSNEEEKFQVHKLEISEKSKGFIDNISFYDKCVYMQKEI